MRSLTVTKSVLAATLMLASLLVSAAPTAAQSTPMCNGIPATIVGTSGPDVLNGTAGDDVIVAFGGADQINTGAGNDLVCAGLGNDTIINPSGEDGILAGRGNDRIVIGSVWGGHVRGGLGKDTIDFSGAGAAVIVDLRLGSYQFIDESTGQIVELSFPMLAEGLEHVVGTPFNDYLQGNGARNKLNGLGGADFLWGRNGKDTLKGGGGPDLLVGANGDDIINGGFGFDTISFLDATGGVTADLRAGTASGEGQDQITKVEILLGSTHDDVLLGSGGRNLLGGREGDDRLEGRGKGDILDGWTGYDILRGGFGFDDCYDGEELYSCENTQVPANDLRRRAVAAPGPGLDAELAGTVTAAAAHAAN